MPKSYRLDLPVFKQGDDLSYQIEQTPGNLKEAFENMACHYDDAAKLCRRVAGVAAEVPELKVHADCHYIEVSGPEDRLAQLVRDDVLSVEEWEDEEDDAECGEKDEDEEEGVGEGGTID